MKRNDVVQLKTGGPEMVVLRLIGDAGEHVMLARKCELKVSKPVIQSANGSMEHRIGCRFFQLNQ
jgi:hypothetical protein